MNDRPLGNKHNPFNRGFSPVVKAMQVAMASVEGKRNISLWEHFFNEAYEDNTVLIAAMKKFAPDLKQIDSEVFTQVSGGIYLGDLSDEDLEKKIRVFESFAARRTIPSQKRTKYKKGTP